MFESGVDPGLSRREIRRVPADRRQDARRVLFLAVLADGQRALSRRRLRPFLCLCADQDRIRHRPLCHGGEAPARRARPPARRGRISLRRRLFDRRHRGVAVVRRAGARALLYGAGEFLSVQEYKNVQRWTDAIAKRPAVQRGRMVNRTWGDPASQLHERHDAERFRDQDAGQDRRAGEGVGVVGHCTRSARQRRDATRKSRGTPWALSKKAPFASTIRKPAPAIRCC